MILNTNVHLLRYFKTQGGNQASDRVLGLRNKIRNEATKNATVGLYPNKH
jgi:hypothetical protein